MATQIPAHPAGLPSWLPAVNRVVMALQRVGFVVGTMHVLTVPGPPERDSPLDAGVTADGQRPPLHCGRAG